MPDARIEFPMTKILVAAALGLVMVNPIIAAQTTSPVTDVTVSGEVHAPAHVVSTELLTLRAAIARVGGFTERAGVIEVRRRSAGSGPLTAATPANEYRIEYVLRDDLTSHPETDLRLTGSEFVLVRPNLELHAPAGRGRFGAGAIDLTFTTWGVTAPVVVTSIAPQYTAAGMALKLQGTIDLQVVVNADGTVGDARVTRGLDARLPDLLADFEGRNDDHSLAVLKIVGNGPLGLDANAIACVKSWTFTPGTILGKPHAILHPVSVDFRLR
jgi:hypothetical protein